MPCYFTIGGEDFDPVSFLEKTRLMDAVVYLKGELINPRRELRTVSLIRLSASKANFDDLESQIKDTIHYLEAHREQLSVIKETPGVTFANVDFGVDLDLDMIAEKGTKTFFWPSDLIKVAGDLGISIELSLYPSWEEEE